LKIVINDRYFRKETIMFSKKMWMFAISVLSVLFSASICTGSSDGISYGDIIWPGCCANETICDEAPCPKPCDDCDDYTSEFNLRGCEGFKTVGKNPYFILIPGYFMILEGEEENDEGESDTIRAQVTVLCKMKWIYVPGMGWIETRVVEEKEWVNDELVEVSWNFFAICNKTNDVYYFGEDVFVCDDGLERDPCGNGYLCEGEEPEHPGQWRVGENGAMPGIIMPGTFMLGAKYCQEQAPSDVPEEAAVDRAVNLAMLPEWSGPAGDFKHCVVVVDTNPAEGICEPEDGDIKIYCRGVGQVQDEELQLVKYGFSKKRHKRCK
jgi:hypothetical protein